LSSEQQRAIDLAYRALGQRERTVLELRAYLERKRVEPEAIDHAVVELKQAGLLDDARFASRFAEDKRTLERWGSERIERDLRRRGVPADLIAATVATQDRSDELAAALALLGDRAPGPLSDERGRDRAWRLLVRKGYEPELAYDAVREHARQRTAR
jgi:regulatory protein